MARGDDLYASGVALVTPLEIEVREEPTAGRVRVTVRDARTRSLVPKVQVKVTGTGNPRFFGGETDLRGVYVAEGVVGQVTAVARRGEGQYAFYRGEGANPVGVSAPTPPPHPGRPPAAVPEAFGASLEQNLRSLNCTNQDRPTRTPQAALQPARKRPQGVQVEGVK